MFDSLPLFTAAVILICVTVFVAQLFGITPNLSSVCLSPSYVVSRLQLYRILLGPFFHAGFLHIALNMFTFYMLAADFEKQVGTLGSAYTIMLVIIPFCGITHTVLAYIFDALSGLTSRLNCAVGISGVLFALIVVALDMYRAEAVSFFGFFTLPRHVYPWFLLIVLSLISPGLSFMGHLAGIVVGYGLCYGVFSFILPTDAKLDELETNMGLKSLPLYQANPLAIGGAGVEIWSRGELPTTAGNRTDGSASGSTIGQWFQVLNAWLRGLGADIRPASFPGQGQTTSGGSVVPPHSRLLQEGNSSGTNAGGTVSQSASDQVLNKSPPSKSVDDETSIGS